MKTRSRVSDSRANVQSNETPAAKANARSGRQAWKERKENGTQWVNRSPAEPLENEEDDLVA
jgi:hypothetical protein